MVTTFAAHLCDQPVSELPSTSAVMPRRNKWCHATDFGRRLKQLSSLAPDQQSTVDVGLAIRLPEKVELIERKPFRLIEWLSAIDQ
jgi:hypothetical protein